MAETLPPGYVLPQHRAAGHLRLEDIEALALAHNPTLEQAATQVQAANGAAFQAGLRLNPNAGYTSDQIGINGTAGELQGGFVSQEFVTGGKRQLSREKYLQRVLIAEIALHAQQARVLNDVRAQFFRTVGTQRLLEIHREILANGQDNVQTHREMLNLGQTNHPGLLRAEVELRRDHLDLKRVNNELRRDRHMLAALAGIDELPIDVLASPQKANRPVDWQTALTQVTANSPEIHAAHQKIRHDEIAVRRERVQPIPNITVDVNGGWNAETSNTVAGVTIGIPLPIFDRNLGSIQQAQADLARSHAEVRRVELSLQNRLAQRFQSYQSAWQRVDEYQRVMLPKAKKAHELLVQGYRERRAVWIDVLTAQRFYLSLKTEYVRSMIEYREADVAIRGMLLSGGLNEPTGPIGGGHIDAVTRPR